ncbi:MAG: CvpA family protein [Candidatus Obscuribacterales bacterium]|nr:CvpA family protein [Candidatus Obscuribacterales bacterium]
MVWDCLIGWVVIVFTVVGWSNGIRSWTIPFSMFIATLISQHIYVDLSALLVETLDVETTAAIFIAYSVCWLGITQYSDSLLSGLIKMKEAPQILPLKLAGGLAGFAKGAGAFVLAAMVAFAHNNVPSPPRVSWQNNWIMLAAADSFLLPPLGYLASRFDEPLGKFVLSDSAPHFKPNFALSADPFASIEKKQEEKGKAFVASWKKFKKDMDQEQE